MLLRPGAALTVVSIAEDVSSSINREEWLVESSDERIARRVSEITYEIEQQVMPGIEHYVAAMPGWAQKLQRPQAQWTLVHAAWWSVVISAASVLLAFSGLDSESMLGLVTTCVLALGGITGLVFVVGWVVETSYGYADKDPFYLRKLFLKRYRASKSGAYAAARGVRAGEEILRVSEDRSVRSGTRLALRELWATVRAEEAASSPELRRQHLHDAVEITASLEDLLKAQQESVAARESVEKQHLVEDEVDARVQVRRSLVTRTLREQADLQRAGTDAFVKAASEVSD